YDAMNDDFNSPAAIAELFEAARIINSVNDGKESITAPDLELLRKFYTSFLFDIFGLKNERLQETGLNEAMEVLIELRNEAKQSKDFNTADRIRDRLREAGFQLKDSKDGTTWS